MNVLKQGLSTKKAKRKLVTIQKITDIQNIENADKLEVATVLNWKVVIQKGKFNIGDKIVFFAIDSFLPNEDKYSFLGNLIKNPITLYEKEVKYGYRIRTMRLRGQISQGLVMPLEDFNLSKELNIGTDITEKLNVTKFERPETDSNLGTVIEDFPTHLADYTDEIRVQDMPEDFEKMKDQSYYMTIKYDGTSVTIIKHTDPETKKSELIVSTRNSVLKEGSMIHRLLRSTGAYDRILNFKEDIVLQGELYGEKIQGNPLNIKGHKIAFFNVEQNHERLDLFATIAVLRALDLDMVDIYEIGSYSPLFNTLLNSLSEKSKLYETKTVDHNFNYSQDELIEKAANTYYAKNKPAEGLVVRPISPDKNKHSFKIINNNYLLKNKL